MNNSELDGDLIRELETLFAEKLFVNVKSPDLDLFQSGILDSMSLVELLLNLEDAFGCSMSIAELEMDDIRSVRKIAELVIASRRDMTTVAKAS